MLPPLTSTLHLLFKNGITYPELGRKELSKYKVKTLNERIHIPFRRDRDRLVNKCTKPNKTKQNTIIVIVSILK